jgi:hypothetical protein
MRSTKYRFGTEHQTRQQLHLVKLYRKKLKQYTQQAQTGKITLDTISQKLRKAGL